MQSTINFRNFVFEREKRGREAFYDDRTPASHVRIVAQFEDDFKSFEGKSKEYNGMSRQEVRTKVVVRLLPPTLTEDAFLELIGEWVGATDWVSYWKGKTRSVSSYHL